MNCKRQSRECKRCGVERVHSVEVALSYMEDGTRIEAFRTCSGCCKNKSLGVKYSKDNLSVQDIYDWVRGIK